MTITPIHKNANEYTLGWARIIVFGIWLFNLVYERPLVDLGARSPDFFLPHGVLRILPSAFYRWLIDPQVLYGFWWVLFAAIVIALVGCRPFRPIVWCVIVLLVLWQGLYRGLGGHVNHRELALLYVTFVLACFPINNRVSLFPSPRKSGDEDLCPAAMFLSCLVIVLTYVFIGATRFWGSDIRIYFTQGMKWWITYHSHLDSEYGFTFGRAVLDHPWFDTLVRVCYPLATVFELLAPLSLFNRTFKRFWIIGFVLPFHFGILLLMNIAFPENCLLMLLFVEYTSWVTPAAVAVRTPASPPLSGPTSELT